MAFNADRAFVLLICIGILAVQLDKVTGLRSIDLALKQGQEDHWISAQNRRILKVVATEGMNTDQKKSAQVNKKFNPNEASKRKVRKGSDPIHNRA